jgi:hypothetical protein
MEEPEGQGQGQGKAGADDGQDARQHELSERLKKTDASLGQPSGGAVIRIDRQLFEPGRLTISSFSIKPYDGYLVAGQMFNAEILLPGEAEPLVIRVAGAVKTVDGDFGLRAIFTSPQPGAQLALATHLMALRPPGERPAKRRKKGAALGWLSRMMGG